MSLLLLQQIAISATYLERDFCIITAEDAQSYNALCDIISYNHWTVLCYNLTAVIFICQTTFIIMLYFVRSHFGGNLYFNMRILDLSSGRKALVRQYEWQHKASPSRNRLVSPHCPSPIHCIHSQDHVRELLYLFSCSSFSSCSPPPLYTNYIQLFLSITSLCCSVC